MCLTPETALTAVKEKTWHCSSYSKWPT